MLTVDDVDRYFTSTEDSICLLNGTEPSCVTLVAEDSDVTDDITGPIIHIHPDKFIYVFYRKGVPVLRAERAVGTGDAVGIGTLGDGDGAVVRGTGGGDEGGTFVQTDNDADDTDDDTSGDGGGSGTPDSSITPDGGGGGGGTFVQTDTDADDTDDDTSGDGDGSGTPDSSITPGSGGSGEDDGSTPQAPQPPDNGGDGNGDGGTTDGGGGNNGGGNGGNNGDGNTDDTDVDPATPGSVDTHHGPNKWIVWVDYEDGIPEGAMPNLAESGLNITVLDENKLDITDQISGFALTQSDGPDSVQFSVPTNIVDANEDEKETLYIVVTDENGNEKTYTATFDETMMPDIMLEPEGNPTSQNDEI